MLKVASFKMSDADGVNALLSKYRLASGAHILVSDGFVMIPFEDGAEDNKDQKIVNLLEQKNIMMREYDILQHSQRVLMSQILGMESRIAELNDQLTLPKTKEGYDKGQEIKTEIKRLEGIVAETKRLHTQNRAEENRMEVNFTIFDASINVLKNS